MSALLLENYKHLQSRIGNACGRSGRRPEDVKIIWVSKTQSRERILEALSIGAGEFGENKVQETLLKFPISEYESQYNLHFIGRLQSNKVRKIIPVCHTIQSIDSLNLLERIDRICGELGVRREVFLQVNTSGESTKSGFTPESFMQTLSGMPAFSHIDLRGLMTIGPFSSDPEASRAAFRRLADLLEEINRRFSSKRSVFKGMNCLSMGMSDDFEVAIEEGSHYIRIGTSLFGQRTR